MISPPQHLLVRQQIRVGPAQFIDRVVTEIQWAVSEVHAVPSGLVTWWVQVPLTNRWMLESQLPDLFLGVQQSAPSGTDPLGRLFKALDERPYRNRYVPLSG